MGTPCPPFVEMMGRMRCRVAFLHPSAGTQHPCGWPGNQTGKRLCCQAMVWQCVCLQSTLVPITALHDRSWQLPWQMHARS